MNASVIRTSLRVSDQQEPEDQDGCGPEERDERLFPEIAVVEKFQQGNGETGDGKPEVLVLNLEHGLGHRVPLVTRTIGRCLLVPAMHFVPHSTMRHARHVLHCAASLVDRVRVEKQKNCAKDRQRREGPYSKDSTQFLSRALQFQKSQGQQKDCKYL